MKLNNSNKVFFLGIGGIGMSALARYFRFLGYQVYGYDRTATELTGALKEAGMELLFEDDPESLASEVKTDRQTLVVYTPAIPADSKLLAFFREGAYPMHKRAEVLGAITAPSKCLAVAGTHGKTTTSAILAHMLKVCEFDFAAFLGGIALNFNSNFYFSGSAYSVVEADEFDRSFLHLSPDLACVTSMDADHLDIYGEKEALTEAFYAFTNRIKPGGKLIHRYGLPLNGITFGFEEACDYRITDYKITDSTYLFDVVTPAGKLQNIAFGLPGEHNLMNALAALAMAAEMGAPLSRLVQALKSFEGISRRFNYIIKSPERVFIDDYAHHPTEIAAVAEAVRSFYPGKKALVVFQPHLFSRTRDFADEFAKSLALFDELILMDIYPARELPMEGITSAWLLEKVKGIPAALAKRDELPGLVSKTDAQVIVTLGAGDIANEVKTLKRVLE